MSALLHLCPLWLGLLLVRFSQEQSYTSRARKLCGRHLLRGIVKLCGDADWSHFMENTPFRKQLALQAMEKVESFLPGRAKSSPNAFRARGRGTDAVSSTASQEEATNNLEIPSPPEYQYNKANLLPNKTRELASSQDISSYVHEIVEFQKQNTNKIKTLRKLFWGNHPQRVRRGYSEKCCLRGCTEEELIIACLPYIDYKNLKKEESQL
ncbi:PREDICTED: insulin-like peptide INSL6 [Myotis brandtii]|uniref:insulin-like peptide INSL6 n=1 Tax=Myotis brandtii TaxID=109478 RepID=UPI0003BBF0FD|nr:PREDICTED: insulin-like peptide INSL6 [Myotis brandtii]